MNITLIAYDDGRGEYLGRTMQSLTERIAYQFDHALLVDDSGNAQYAEWLDRTFPSFRHIHHAQRIGFAGAIRSGWSHVPKCDYVFSLECDFTFNEPIDIPLMARVLEYNPHLAQLVLLRQPWNDAEVAAGGIMQLHEDWYTERETCGTWISEHRAYFSTNPNLMPYEVIRDPRGSMHSNPRLWPLEAQSEGKYGARLRDDGYSFAFLGRKHDAPRVEHIGIRRVGVGY